MMLLPVAAALAVTVQPAFGLDCRPAWNAGAAVIEASNDGEARRVSVEMVDYQQHVAEIVLDLPARSHKRLVVMPPIAGRVTVALVEEDGRRTPLAYPFRQECQGPAIAAFLRQDGRAGLAIPAASGSVALEAGELTREDLGEWRPLMSLDAMAAEARAISELADAEREAIRRWVMAGGVLVVVPGVDPNPLFASGWLPAGVENTPPWSSRTWGAGAVAVVSDMDDPRIGGLLLVTSSTRDGWMRAVSSLFEAQRDAAGPTGRASQPAGILTLGAFLLMGAVAHELLRRRFVTGTRDFPRYFRGSAITLGAVALSGFGAALAGSTGVRTADVVVAHRTGWGVRSRAVLLGPGTTRDIASGAWPFTEPEVRLVSGARSAVTNGPGSTRVALERVPVVLGDGFDFDASGAIENRSGLDFDAGVLLTPSGCTAIPAVRANAKAPVARVGCMDSPDLQGASTVAQALGMPVYAARAGGTLHVISMEPK